MPAVLIRRRRAGAARCPTPAAALIAAALGCTDADLARLPTPPPAPADNLVQLSGTLCTRDPEEIRFPVRIAFVIDTSQSMTISDPRDPVTGETGRQRAVREAIAAVGRTPDVAFALVAFNGSTQVTTQVDRDGDGAREADGFTPHRSDDDRAELAGAVADLGRDSSTTNYAGALATVYQLILSDALGLQQQDAALVGRARYVVVFLSDGLPDTDAPLAQAAGAIYEAVGDLAQLRDQLRIGEVTLHTAYLSANATPQVALAAGELLRGMAEAGAGTFRSFPNGEQINFLAIDYTSIRRVFALTHLIVFNRSALPRSADPDTDGDGVPDPRPVLDVRDVLPDADSDGDGLRDLAEPICTTAGMCDDADACDADACRDRAGCDDDPTLCDDPLCCDDPSLCDDPRWAEQAGVCGHPACAGAAPCDDGPACDDPPCCREPRLCDDPPCCDRRRTAGGPDPCDARGWSDADGDGFSDLLEARLARAGAAFSGCDPRDGQCPSALDRADRDGDGLRDCEELYLGSNPQRFDADSDGVPDPIEVALGTDPAAIDVHDDLDLDAADNLAEVRAHTDPHRDESGERARRSYRYAIDELALTGTTTCVRYVVDNVALADTAAVADRDGDGDQDAGWNDLLVYAGETPYDRPDDFALWRLACVRARYLADERLKVPASGRLVLLEEDFHPVGGCDPADPTCDAPRERFDPERHCVDPATAAAR